MAFISENELYLIPTILLSDKYSMKVLISLILFTFSSLTSACPIKSIPMYISKTLDIPTIQKQDISIKTLPNKITLAKYTEGCGIIGCNYFILQQTENSCYQLLGSYHGILNVKKATSKDFPEFELSFSSGHKMNIIYDSKQKKYIEND